MGHLPRYRADPFGFIEACVRAHGEFVRLRFGPFPALLVASSDVAEEVLVAKPHLFRKGGQLYRVLRRFLGNGPLVNEGEDWQRQRALLEPAFARDDLEAREPAIRSCVQRWTDTIVHGEQRDVSRDMVGLATRIVAGVLFDAPLSGADLTVLEGAYSVGADELYRLGTGAAQLVPRAVPLPANLRLRSASRELDEVVYRIIRQRRAEPADGDLLSMLLQRAWSKQVDRDDRELRDVMVNLLSSARETGVTLAWMWALLARHPDALTTVEDELGTVLSGRHPTSADLPRLPATQGVVRETLRLYPAGPIIARQTAQDCTLGGHPLRKGTIVFLSPWATHRDGRYFDDPDCFRPERWTGGLAERLPAFAYLPFGAGPRACLASAWAPRLCALVLAALAQHLRFSLAPGQVVRPAAGFAPRPSGGLTMSVHRRRPR